MTEVEFCGTSMTPIIRPPATVVCCTQRPPHRGDIVLFPDDELLLAHRLVGWRGSGHEARMLLRGDNRRYLDPPLPAHACLGVVVEVRCKGKRLDCTRPIVRAAFRVIATSGGMTAPRCEGKRPLGVIARCGAKLHRLVCHVMHGLLLITSWRHDAQEQ